MRFSPLHHLRTYPRTVLRNLPSVQWFVSAQVLQPALTAAPRRLQPIPVPTLITPSPNKNLPPLHRAHSLDSTTLHLLAILSLFEYISSADARDHRSPQRAHLPSAPCPRYPPPFLSLSMPPPFCPLLSQRPKAVKSDLVVRFQFSRKARYSSSAIQTKTNSVKNASEAMPNFEPYQPSSLLTANLPYTFLKYPPPFPPSPPFSYSCSSHPIFSSFYSSFSSSSFSASSVSSPSPSYSSESKIKKYSPRYALSKQNKRK